MFALSLRSPLRIIMNNAEQQFLNELDNKFWKAADKLRANMDAANYKGRCE